MSFSSSTESTQLATIEEKNNREIPWGIKHQLWESTESKDCRREEATALYNGIIDITPPNSTGNLNLTTNQKQRFNFIISETWFGRWNGWKKMWPWDALDWWGDMSLRDCGRCYWFLESKLQRERR